jgi:hypothetical protein
MTNTQYHLNNPDQHDQYSNGFKAGYEAGQEDAASERDAAMVAEIVAMDRDFGPMLDAVAAGSTATLTALYPFQVAIMLSAPSDRRHGDFCVISRLSMLADYTEVAMHITRRDGLLEWLGKTGWNVTDFTINERESR